MVLLLHWSLRGERLRKFVLLVASYYFYGAWNRYFCLLMAGSSALDYGVGLALGRTEDPRKRKLLLTASLIGNLGSLAFFKYWNFFSSEASAGLAALGLEVHARSLDIILPVGISFYTFQTLSYTIDVYRRELEPRRSFLDFFLFVSFFPQLVAGPIVRARDFLWQLEKPRRFDGRNLLEGFDRFLIGLFKKLMIADLVAPLVDKSYGEIGACSGPEMLAAAAAFCIQIYADFSGYSDMAIGCAKMFGYELQENFRLPYLSVSVTDYWRRWHISLSSWFRDYVYIPMGGNRRGVFRTYRNLVVTFLLTGLWHGANWTFVAFGAWNGLMLILERVLRAAWKRSGFSVPDGLGRALRPLGWVYMATSTIISFVFFRARSIGEAFEVFRQIVSDAPGYPDLFLWRMFYSALGLIVVYHVLARLRLRERLQRMPARDFVRSAIWSFTIAILLAFAPIGTRSFIYFQF